MNNSLRFVLWASTLALLASCGVESLTTDTRSSSLPSDERKVEFLRRYLQLPSTVETAEFHIVFHDNSRGVPGPSDYSIEAAIKVAPAAVPSWLAGLEPDGPVGLPAWAQELLPAGSSDARWAMHSTPRFYRRPGSNVCLWLFEAEGVVFKKLESGTNDCGGTPPIAGNL
jgi:hypothetical protein